jgi:hypothetical protein
MPVISRTVSHELMATLNVGRFIRVNGQKESPFGTELLKIIAAKTGTRTRNRNANAFLWDCPKTMLNAIQQQRGESQDFERSCANG